MIQKICKFLFRISGWKGDGVVVSDRKCIIIGVPHTSALDFVIVWVYYTSLGGKMNFLIKKEFFFWPFGYFVRKMGGISIDRSRGANVIRQAVREFEIREHLQLAITPEGTRKRARNWKAGFHTIARLAGVPVYLTSFDWSRKQMTIWGRFEITGNPTDDIKRMKRFYREKGVQGRFPDRFCTEE